MYPLRTALARAAVAVAFALAAAYLVVRVTGQAPYGHGPAVGFAAYFAASQTGFVLASALMRHGASR